MELVVNQRLNLRGFVAERGGTKADFGVAALFGVGYRHGLLLGFSSFYLGLDVVAEGHVGFTRFEGH